MEKLTNREQDICKYLVKGMKNVEIAKQLNLSKHTVKSYISEILIALDARNRTEAAYILGKNNIIQL